ncbi:hypothetical protein PPUJ20066_08240 [Pseudomonas putida]|nr:hypothetical protein PPUJ20066_08240 [Pseudomonas putida]
MKFLDDVWESVSGAARVRVSDPFMGAFLVSWVVCNWNHIGLLLWGEDKVSARINAFSEYISGSSFFAFNSIFFVPFLFSVFYVLVFPWLSLFFKFLLRSVNGKHHRQAIGVELEKITQQEELNKARLRSDPDKPFLGQTLEYEVERKSEILKHLSHRTSRFKNMAAEAAARLIEAEAGAAEARSKANVARLEEVSKKKQVDLESIRFNVNTSKLKSVLASQRFPSVYFFMSKIEESFRSDDVHLSLTTVGEVVAAIFGYKNFQLIMEDEGFNNDAFSKVEYVYYDSEKLAARFEDIVSADQAGNEELTSDLLFEHVRMVFDDLPYDLVDLDGLEERCLEFFEDHKNSILDENGVSGAMAESDTIFEEIHFEEIHSIVFARGFSAKIQAYAKGHHRKDSSVSGRTMSIEIEIGSRLQVGGRALGGFDFFEVHGTLEDFYDPEDEIDNQAARKASLVSPSQ